MGGEKGDVKEGHDGEHRAVKVPPGYKWDRQRASREKAETQLELIHDVDKERLLLEGRAMRKRKGPGRVQLKESKKSTTTKRKRENSDLYRCRRQEGTSDVEKEGDPNGRGRKKHSKSIIRFTIQSSRGFFGTEAIPATGRCHPLNKEKNESKSNSSNKRKRTIPGKFRQWEWGVRRDP